MQLQTAVFNPNKRKLNVSGSQMKKKKPNLNQIQQIEQLHRIFSMYNECIFPEAIATIFV